MDKDSLNLLSFSIPGSEDITRYAFEAMGRFSLSDSKSCVTHQTANPGPQDCNREILRIDAKKPLTVVAFDEWQKDNSDSTCDYLIFDSGEVKNQFAFCELTCSIEKYVEPSVNKPGKRAKAYSQMVETWRLISESENPVFQADILRYVKKIGLFGWRDRKDKSQTGPMRSLRTFITTPSSRAGIAHFSNYAFGENFDFIQVKYPNIFTW